MKPMDAEKAFWAEHRCYVCKQYLPHNCDKRKVACYQKPQGMGWDNYLDEPELVLAHRKCWRKAYAIK